MNESFNIWIREAWCKLIMDHIDMIRSMIMEQRYERKLNAIRWWVKLVLYVKEYIREITIRKEHFIIRHLTSYKAEVVGKKKDMKWTLKLENVVASQGIGWVSHVFMQWLWLVPMNISYDMFMLMATITLLGMNIGSSYFICIFYLYCVHWFIMTTLLLIKI